MASLVQPPNMRRHYGKAFVIPQPKHRVRVFKLAF